MFKNVSMPSQLLLEDELVHALKTLRGQTPGSAEYVKTLDATVRIYEMLEEKKPTSVSKDTLANIGAHLAGIILIIKHEHVNVIASKALSFVPRLK